MRLAGLLKARSSKPVLYAALIGDLLVAFTKTAAAIMTGSAAMTSEAVHSFVDTGNEILLLYGIHRSGRRPDLIHPLGYGRELYFWSFIVALLVFAVGAGVSVYEGINHILDPEPIQNPVVNYIVLTLAFFFEGSSWLFSLLRFKGAKGDLNFYNAIRQSKDPPSFIVLLEDSAALLGILVAATGIFAAVAYQKPVWDGVASIVIGLILGCTSIFLARESKSLLIGEQANPSLHKSILSIATAQPAISRANGVLTVQLAPNQVMAALSLEFADNLKAPEIEDQVIDLERKVRAAHPEIVALFVKPQTDKTFREGRKRRFGEETMA